MTSTYFSSRKIKKPLAIVMDIEGTICDQHFIARQLFPLIRKKLRQFVTKTYETPETRQLIQCLMNQVRSGATARMPKIDITSKDRAVSSVETNICWQMDRKIGSVELKSTQLLCWVWLYETNLIRGHVFDDVSPALYNWKVKSGVKLCTYSSGDVSAQRLLLCNTNHGNVGSLIDHYFDKTYGLKSRYESYRTIVKEIGLNPWDVMYITDSLDEAANAKAAGMRPVVINRPGGKQHPKTLDYAVVNSFKDIQW